MMPKNELSTLTLEIIHDQDWTTSLKTFNKDELRITSLQSGVVSADEDFEVIIVKASREKYYKFLLEILKTSPLILNVDYKFSLSPKYHLLYIRARSDISIVKRCFQTNSVVLELDYVEGLEKWKILGIRENLDQLARLIRGLATVKRLRIEPLRFEHLDRGLMIDFSQRELQSLITAYHMGYFDYPRKCSLKEIAEQLSISKATANEYLHKAIYKLLRKKIINNN
jgi:Predicted DNA binding protein